MKLGYYRFRSKQIIFMVFEDFFKISLTAASSFSQWYFSAYTDQYRNSFFQLVTWYRREQIFLYNFHWQFAYDL